jgi:CheY-like chemotaxis protein
VLQVWDTGCGMSRALRERIFDDYTQGHNPERQRRQGLGLGLAVVRRLADAGAYRVTVRSRPGRGSCFTVWLPSAPLPSAQLPSTVGEFAIGRPADGAAPRVPQASLPCPPLIALIDDDDDVRQATRDTLQHGGWQVADGASSQQAIDAVARLGRMPVAVLSDHRLSAHADGTHEDGLQAIQALRHEFGLALPAFLLTGDLDPSLPRQCQAQGIVHLRKPLSTTDLLQAVSQNLPDRTSDTNPSG